jgi:sortase A
MKGEPSIEQLEKLIIAFRKQGGSDAELSLLAQDILHEYLPQSVKKLEEIFPKENHPSVVKIKDFKKNPEHPFKEAIRTSWHKKRVKYPVIFISLFISIFIVLNLPLFMAKFEPTPSAPTYEKVKEVVQPVMDKSAPLEPGEVIPNGNFLLIPKIGVNAPIIFAQSANEKAIQGDLKSGVVHYKDTALPGETGNSFITGHSSNYWWDKGKYNYIFANLNRLALGDQAKIYYNGNKFLYQVKKIEVVEPSNVNALQQTTTPTLTLMTCTPPGTSWKRLIIKLDQVSPLYQAPIVVEKYKEIPKFNELPKTNSNIFLDWVAKIFRF